MVLPVAAAGAVAAGSGATGAGAASAGVGAAGGGMAGASAAGGGAAGAGGAAAQGVGAAGGGMGATARGAGEAAEGTPSQGTAGKRAAQLNRSQSRQRLMQQIQQAVSEDQDEPKPEPQISDMMVIIGFLVLGFADLVQVIIVFAGLDDFWILDILCTGPILIYLFFKGMSGALGTTKSFLKKLLLFLLEAIPYVGALPWNTIAWAWIVWADRHPDSTVVQVAQVAEKAIPQSMSKPAAPQSVPKTNVAA